MKVLILSNDDIGLYNFRKELIQELILKKHQVMIALPGGERIIDFMKMGCNYYQVEMDRRGTNPAKDFILLTKYFNLIRKYKPDVLLTYTIKPNIYGGISARILRVKYIANITGLGTAIENGGWKKCLLFFLYKIALKQSACVFFQNKQNEQLFIDKKIVAGKRRLIPGSGVNICYHSYEIYPSKDTPIKLLFIGRIMKNKGVNEFFEVVKKIKADYPAVIFQIAGYCEENYKNILNKLQEKGYLQYLGFKNDVRPYIKECWAVVLPSYHEGLSNVLLEASAAGRPVLASQIPGCKETFEEGVSGFGFEPRNTESLQTAIESFINLSYEEKKKMGEKAREKMEKEFDRKIVVTSYMEELYG